MTLYIPIGPPASGKSTLTAYLLEISWLSPDAIVSPDKYRVLLTGDVRDQSANGAVFQICDVLIRHRLKRGLDVWCDATNLRSEWRDTAEHAAKRHEQPIVYILMTASEAECQERNSKREAPIPLDVMERMFELRRAVKPYELPGHVYDVDKFIERVASGQQKGSQ